MSVSSVSRVVEVGGSSCLVVLDVGLSILSVSVNGVDDGGGVASIFVLASAVPESALVTNVSLTELGVGAANGVTDLMASVE